MSQKHILGLSALMGISAYGMSKLSKIANDDEKVFDSHKVEARNFIVYLITSISGGYCLYRLLKSGTIIYWTLD